MSISDNQLKRYELQEILFSEIPRRLAIQEIKVTTEEQQLITMNVWRNHAFETLIEQIRPYANNSSYMLEYNISDYDDSLLFFEHKASDIELIWLDSSRYTDTSVSSDFMDWLVGRVSYLRSISAAPIIVASWLDGRKEIDKLKLMLENIPAVYYSDIGAISNIYGVSHIDLRMLKISGSSLAAKSQSIIARELACHWLPGLLCNGIKAIAIDLDNTLYSGVLGEDGVDGIILSSQHISLQLYIKKLKDQGMFISIVSKNEHSDVKKLFNNRNDFILNWDDFSDIQISWGSKADAIRKIANNLRISVDAILFVDDNVGELSSVVSAFPEINTVYAHNDADITKRAIEYYPGVWRWKVGAEDVIRLNDLRENKNREKALKNSNNLKDYFKSLEIKLTFNCDLAEHQNRIYELCKKTNQFNLNLTRPTLVEVSSLMLQDNVSLISVELSDRLSDSGVIAVVIGVLNGMDLIVEELCISCRALGRQLESSVIYGALKTMPLFGECENIIFNVKRGPRNQPGINWVSDFIVTGEQLNSNEYSISKADLNKLDIGPQEDEGAA